MEAETALVFMAIGFAIMGVILSSASPKVALLSQAIAFAEGFPQPGAIPTLANNPGDLELQNNPLGTMGEGITIFPDLASGWNALYAQVGRILGGSGLYLKTDSFSSFAHKYVDGPSAPVSQDSQNWAANVVSFLNQNNPGGTQVTTGTTLGAWLQI